MSKKLIKQWMKAKSELAVATAKEKELRDKIALTIKDEDKLVVEMPDLAQKITFRKQQNYSIPKAGIPSIQKVLGQEMFDKCFTTSYKIKTAPYSLLVGKNKKAVDKHLTIKPAPLKVEIADL